MDAGDRASCQPVLLSWLAFSIFVPLTVYNFRIMSKEGNPIFVSKITAKVLDVIKKNKSPETTSSPCQPAKTD